MSSNLIKQLPKLEIIAQLKSLKARKLVLAEFSSDDLFCKAVREIARNTVQRNVKLSESDKKRLRKYRKVIISLGMKRKDKKRTKAIMQQTGTGIFLPIVVPLVASVISQLLAK